MKKSKRKIPAIPPEDYKGSTAAWMVELQKRGHWPEYIDWYGDIELDADEWRYILETCEK